jgi:hypothetical protein
MSEYLVDQPLRGLDPASVDRFAAELQEFVSRVSVMLSAQRRGVGVAPAYLRPLAVQLEAEADRRDHLDDVTADAWRALAESVELSLAVADIERGFDVSLG